MKFDDLLRNVGEFGPYQRRVYSFMCVPAITIGSFMILNVVILGVPDHRSVILNCLASKPKNAFSQIARPVNVSH